MASDETNVADETASLYDRLGQRDGIEAVVDTFYDRVLADDQLEPYFEEMAMDELRSHQTAFLSAVTGGPGTYDGQNMRAAHEHLDLDGADFAAVAAHLESALTTHGVSEDDREAVLDEVRSLEAAIVAQ